MERDAAQHVISIIERRLLVIKRGKAHALEVPPVALLPPHHDPHAAPLRQVDRLDDPWNLIDEGDGSGDVVKYRDIPDLLPRHWHVLQQLEHGMRHVLEGT